MDRLATIAFLTALSLFPYTEIQAGNKEMMEKEAKALVDLNERVLRQLGHPQQDGVIVLKANVVMDGDQLDVQVENSPHYSGATSFRLDAQSLYESGVIEKSLPFNNGFFVIVPTSSEQESDVAERVRSMVHEGEVFNITEKIPSQPGSLPFGGGVFLLLW